MESVNILWNIVYVLNNYLKMMLSVRNFVLVIVVVGGEFATSRGEKSLGAGSKGEPCTSINIQ